MNLHELALYKAMEGEAEPSVTVEPLEVTENGEYSEEGKAYSPVTVNVPEPSFRKLNIVNNSDSEIYVTNRDIKTVSGVRLVSQSVPISTPIASGESLTINISTTMDTICIAVDSSKTLNISRNYTVGAFLVATPFVLDSRNNYLVHMRAITSTTRTLTVTNA